MTLNDLERQNRGFYGFFGDFGLRDTFQEQIAPKSIEIDMEQLHMKFSPLNVDFDGPSLDFLGSTCAWGHRRAVPRKSRYFTVVVQSFAKTVAGRHGHAIPITTSTSDELFSRISTSMTLNRERPWTSKIRGFIDFCNLRLQRTIQEWTETKWLEIDRQFANRNCYRLSRVSWALAQISCHSSCYQTGIVELL